MEYFYDDGKTRAFVLVSQDDFFDDYICSMGNFRIVIDAVGGHGQDRSKKDGEVVDFTEGGQNPNSPEAVIKNFIDQLQSTANGMSIQGAKVFHWPANETETPLDGAGNECITDDLLTGVRKGSF